MNFKEYQKFHTAIQDLSIGPTVTSPAAKKPLVSSDQVLRAAIVKNIRGLSYEQLAFNLSDSVSTIKRFIDWKK